MQRNFVHLAFNQVSLWAYPTSSIWWRSVHSSQPSVPQRLWSKFLGFLMKSLTRHFSNICLGNWYSTWYWVRSTSNNIGLRVEMCALVCLIYMAKGEQSCDPQLLAQLLQSDHTSKYGGPTVLLPARPSRGMLLGEWFCDIHAILRSGPNASQSLGDAINEFLDL